MTPLLSLRLLTPERVIPADSRSLWDRVSRRSQRFFEGMDAYDLRVLEWSLTHRRLVLAAVVVSFVGSLFLVTAPWFGLKPLIGTEFFPPSDENQFRVVVKAPVGTRGEGTERDVHGGGAHVPPGAASRCHAIRVSR